LARERTTEKDTDEETDADEERTPPLLSESELERYFAEIERAKDVTTAAFAADQRPIPGFRGVVRNGKSFPGKPFATVRAYTMNHFVGARCDRAVLDDGRLAPCLTLPGAELDGEALEPLLRAIQMRSPTLSVLMGVPTATHAFVFFDDKGVPVAELLIYGIYRWSLSAFGAEHDQVPEAARPLLREVCEKSGVGMCFGSSFGDAELGAFVWSEWNRRRVERADLGYRLKPTKLPIPATTNMTRLTERDKRLLCLWAAQHSTSALTTNWSGRVPIDDDSALEPLPERQAHWQRRLRWDECVQRFPSCNLALADLLPCQDHAQRGDPLFADRAMRAQCEAVRHCLWGFETQSGPEPPEIKPGPWDY